MNKTPSFDEGLQIVYELEKAVDQKCSIIQCRFHYDD